MEVNHRLRSRHVPDFQCLWQPGPWGPGGDVSPHLNEPVAGLTWGQFDIEPDAPEPAGLEASSPASVGPLRVRTALGPAPDEAQLAFWVRAVVDRDEAALTALYDHTSPRIYALAWRITQDAQLAEEVVEDTYWQVWRQAPRFDAERGCVLAWLLAMARSRAIDALRRDQRFRHEHLDEEEAGQDGEVPAVPLPQDLLESTRGSQRLHQALARLDPGPRQLIALAFFRGLTHEEIASQTALPLGTIKSQIRRALAGLKRDLEAAEAGPGPGAGVVCVAVSITPSPFARTPS